MILGCIIIIMEICKAPTPRLKVCQLLIYLFVVAVSKMRTKKNKKKKKKTETVHNKPVYCAISGTMMLCM